MELGGFTDVGELDTNGWSALHHACDASSYSYRALQAALELADITPIECMNSHTTGSQPRGYTALHFACDGSDKTFSRAELACALINKRADLEARADSGNTAFLLAGGSGVTDIVNVLIEARADVTAENDRKMGALEMSKGSSTDTKKALLFASTPMTKATSSGRTRTGISEVRHVRYVRAAQDPNLRGKSWKRG